MADDIQSRYLNPVVPDPGPRRQYSKQDIIKMIHERTSSPEVRKMTAGLIEHETGGKWDPTIRPSDSPASAVGLGQVVPKWKGAYMPLDADIYDPRAQVDGVVSYLEGRQRRGADYSNPESRKDVYGRYNQGDAFRRIKSVAQNGGTLPAWLRSSMGNQGAGMGGESMDDQAFARSFLSRQGGNFERHHSAASAMLEDYNRGKISNPEGRVPVQNQAIEAAKNQDNRSMMQQAAQGMPSTKATMMNAARQPEQIPPRQAERQAFKEQHVRQLTESVVRKTLNDTSAKLFSTFGFAEEKRRGR